MGSTNRGRSDTGSLFHDKGLKRWVVMAALPKTADGKRRRSKHTFRTKAEAMGFLTGGTTAEPEPVDVTVSDLPDYPL